MQVGDGVDVGVVSGNVHHHGHHGIGLQRSGKTPVTVQPAGQLPDRAVQKDGVTRDTGVVLIARTYHRGAARPVSGKHSLDHAELHQWLIPQKDKRAAALRRDDFLERIEPESKGVGEAEMDGVVDDSREACVPAQGFSCIVVDRHHHVPAIQDLTPACVGYHAQHVGQDRATAKERLTLVATEPPTPAGRKHQRVDPHHGAGLRLRALERDLERSAGDYCGKMPAILGGRVDVAVYLDACRRSRGSLR